MVSLMRGRVLEDLGEVRSGVPVDVGHHRGLLEILLKRRKLRVQLLQIVIQACHQGAEVIAVTAKALGERAQRCVQMHRVDLVQYICQRLEQRIDLELNRGGLDLRAGPQRGARWLVGRDELDGLGAENRCAGDADDSV